MGLKLFKTSRYKKYRDKNKKDIFVFGSKEHRIFVIEIFPFHKPAITIDIETVRALKGSWRKIY